MMDKQGAVSDPDIYYKDKLQTLESQKAILEKKDAFFERTRFLLFFGGLGGSLVCIFWISPYFAFLSLGFLVYYLGFIKKHEALKNRIKENKQALEIVENEIKALDGDFSSFSSGESFINPQHDYASDLDLFGDHSIFQYCNRTLSPGGENLFASWFLLPASKEIIQGRQEGIQELARNPDWVHDFRNLKIQGKTDPLYLESLFKWLKKPIEVSFPKELGIWLKVLPWIMGSLGLGLGIQFLFPEFSQKEFPLLNYLSTLFAVIFLFNLWLASRFTKKINFTHQILSSQSQTLLAFSKMIGKVEEKTFVSAELSRMKSRLDENPKASRILSELSRLVDDFDRRNNILIALLTNGIYLSDIHLVIRLENWKESYSEKPANWFQAIYHLEALISLAVVAFNETEWTFPDPEGSGKSIRSEKMGHPLIPKSKRVVNSLDFQSPKQVVLITGSNMAGKSTFLRTIGVNLVLAQLGSKVCATFFQFQPVHIYTSLRIVDSLQENTSSFYAELKRLEVLVKKSKSGENIFFLLDEILRGTNSNDRYLGSRAMIKHLIRTQVYGILATHDLRLGDMEREFPIEIENQHFDVSVKGDELFFDYTLKPGICNSLNASILMKKIGLEIED